MKKVLPLTLIAVAGGLFAFWYFQIRQESGQQNSSQNAQTPSPTPPIQNNSPEQQPAQQNYFVISEWGVKFPIEKLYADDIEYRELDSGPTILFGSKRLAAIEPDCGGKNDSVGINIGISRDTDSTVGIYATYIKKLGDYHFFLIQPRQTTCDVNKKLTKSDYEYLTSLYKAIKGGVNNLESTQQASSRVTTNLAVIL